jgi:hypothetical protein
MPRRIVKSRHDHNVVPGCQTATNVRAHKERLPWAMFQDKQAMTMPAWDAVTTLDARRASKARAADYR